MPPPAASRRWRSARRPLAAGLLSLAVGADATPQRRPGDLTFAPATGVTLYAGDRTDSTTALATAAAVGADVAVGLPGPWSARLGYRTVQSGRDRPRVHSLALTARRDVVSSRAGQVYAEVGAHLAGRVAGRRGIGGGPVVGAGLVRPIGGPWTFSLAGSVAAVFPDGAADGLGQRGADGLAEASLAVGYRLRSSCVPPQLRAVRAPSTLAPYARGAFEAETESADALVAWDFGDDVQVGRRVEWAFPVPGRYEVAVTVAGCGRVTTAVVAVHVQEPCWAPPAITAVTIEPAAPLPGEPVTLTALAEGTPPLRYRWRPGASADTARSVTVAFSTPGLHGVELSVTNCTGDVASRPAVVDVADPERFDSVAVAFDYGGCTYNDAVTVPDVVPSGTLFGPEVTRRIARRLSADPASTLFIEGYADTVAAGFNWTLSRRRAERVRSDLLRALEGAYPDLDTTRLVVHARGVARRRPCFDEAQPGCQAARRVTVRVASGSLPPASPEGSEAAGVPPDRGCDVPNPR